MKHKYLFPSLSFNIVLDVLENQARRKNKRYPDWKLEAQLYIFAYNIILCIEYPKDLICISLIMSDGEQGTLLHCWWECKLVQPLWKTVWGFLKKLEIELPYDPAIPLLGIHTEETRSERDTCTPNVHRSTVYNSQDMETT